MDLAGKRGISRAMLTFSSSLNWMLFVLRKLSFLTLKTRESETDALGGNFPYFWTKSLTMRREGFVGRPRSEKLTISLIESKT